MQDLLLRTALAADQAWALIEAAADTLGFSTRRGGSSPHALGTATVPERGTGADLLLLPSDHEREPEELEALAQRCGYRPAGSLQVAGWTRSGGRDQARFVAALAEAGGDLLIDLNGMASHSAGRSGTILEIPYATAEADSAVSHVVDRHFLLTWLNDPDFRLPK